MPDSPSHPPMAPNRRETAPRVAQSGRRRTMPAAFPLDSTPRPTRGRHGLFCMQCACMSRNRLLPSRSARAAGGSPASVASRVSMFHARKACPELDDFQCGTSSPQDSLVGRFNTSRRCERVLASSLPTTSSASSGWPRGLLLRPVLLLRQRRPRLIACRRPSRSRVMLCVCSRTAARPRSVVGARVMCAH